MEQLFKKHRMFISQVDMSIVREIVDKINWQKQLVAIKGSRGVGKTTLMRQYIKKTYGVQPGKALYCVMDSIYFTTHSLLDMAENFYMMGGEHLFLDEVHKYPIWSKEIKEINDLYPNLKVTFTGSSLIQILNADADLSRRVLSYTMEGLSFREFLHFYKGIQLPIFSLQEILQDPDSICDKVNEVCRPQQMFEEYLRVGYYPFYDGNETEYYSRIENVINFIVEQEMPLFCGVEPAFTRKMKAMLLFLASNLPYEVNIAKLASYLELNKSTVLSYLSSMQRAELLHLLYADNKSVTKMQKPDKIFLHNTNMLFALAQNSVIGTIRECFVVNQLAVNHTVEYGKSVGDFKIDGKITFEVGGHDKSFDQIANVPDSYILADSMEYPIGKKLPIWLVGMTY
ncbi:MAG: AAA family ATPase [Muribaculaceae bacterium]|nr:AAA family ATPase [Bacteroidales bacterium]MDY2732897.1 AAA family ATPase [Muribaculaceae bacterium]MDY4649370.1 AAA family ATPase [Muribaculaceae bacterium]MDY5388624.1 AAA family ATPase [Muribaculaceae bacterium]